MHLLLGDPEDPWCLSVRTALETRRYPTRILVNPLAHPARFAWRLNNERSVSRIVGDAGSAMRDDQIAGVLVRSTGWIDPAGWQPDDLAYMQAETQAALLAWLWSLSCPVVNRYPPAIWYQPRNSLLSWQRLMRRCGLPASEALVTNVEEEARAWGRRQARDGVAGAIYGPLTSEVRYLVIDDKDWNGLAAMQRWAPVCLVDPHGAPQFVCVVGERVVWEGEPSPEAVPLEPALRRFASAAGLAFLEFALAATSHGLRVVAIEPSPHAEHFGGAARRQIVDGIVQLLTADVANRNGSAAPTSPPGLS